MTNLAQRPGDLPASNHYASTDAVILGKEYAYLWSIAAIVDTYKSIARNSALTAVHHMDRYKVIEKATNCPWFFIAVIHCREASFDFSANLANGQRWDMKTTIVPIGRGPFNSFEDAAIDALGVDRLTGKSDWSLATVFYRFERYNGMGYRGGGVKDFTCHAHYQHGSLREGTGNFTYHGSMQDTTPRNSSPYIYNGTQFYQRGVSIEDHSFYPNANDDNIGCMALLKALENELNHRLFDDQGNIIAATFA